MTVELVGNSDEGALSDEDVSKLINDDDKQDSGDVSIFIYMKKKCVLFCLISLLKFGSGDTGLAVNLFARVLVNLTCFQLIVKFPWLLTSLLPPYLSQFFQFFLVVS